MADLRERSSQMKARWRSEKEIIDRIRKTKEDIEQIKVQADQYERAGDYGKVAELRYGKIVELQKQLDADHEKLTAAQSTGVMLKEEVDEEDIAQVVAKWTGVPVSKMLEGEMHKLVTMEERLAQRVIGQDEALTAVANAVRRARGAARSESAHRLVYFPGSNRRRKSRKRRVLWPSLCLTTNAPWCAWTCPSIWKSTLWPE
ncbi:MAG: hypothetical protein WKF84_14940 [Pyrinomonadaceae bacterium]